MIYDEMYTFLKYISDYQADLTLSELIDKFDLQRLISLGANYYLKDNIRSNDPTQIIKLSGEGLYFLESFNESKLNETQSNKNTLYSRIAAYASVIATLIAIAGLIISIISLCK